MAQLTTTSVEAACCIPATTAPTAIEEPDDTRLALMAKALGHPVRIRILRLLLERQSCMTGEMVAELPLAQSTVSEHLRVLREAGLIQGEIEGPRTSYCVSAAGLAALRAGISSL
ncbi:MAG: ArsR/SmtB family transcription factor [Candidatus Dormibacteria bacterium]